jgi:ATPase family associated with various cellular activities (AAA)
LNTSFDEIADEVVMDEAYPQLGRPVEQFIERYLSASETVLILLRPPGMGKTRLVRAILGATSRRKEDSAIAMYTADKRALEGDEIFVDFITGQHDAFIIEDADHLLQPRTDGNRNLYRFLMIADGVVRAQNRKLIFTTNLPNIGSFDEALLRPGRCFATIQMRPLARKECCRPEPSTLRRSECGSARWRSPVRLGWRKSITGRGLSGRRCRQGGTSCAEILGSAMRSSPWWGI